MAPRIGTLTRAYGGSGPNIAVRWTDTALLDQTTILAARLQRL
ncbi:hypothetical protein CP157_03762 (plasmid) [Paracoccus marcusii]|jgi:hypothetical protein|nr:hypothetical protein CP157_03762 [Paracoccus marcusii]